MADMGCYEHPDRKVVGSCPKCGKFMCKECVEKYSSKLCETCEKERLAEEDKKLAAKKAQLKGQANSLKNDAKKDLIKAAVISIAFGIFGFIVGSSDETVNMGLTMAYMFAGFPWGWNVIKQIMDDGVMFFAALNGNWFVAFFIKAVLGAVIGALIWPFIIGWKIYKFVKANNVAKNIDK